MFFPDENVAATHGADLERHVYWAGHSNGCAMAQRMAAEAPEIVAAVGCQNGLATGR
jgi:poly(3-hydroxybutyrate) depolymerase